MSISRRKFVAGALGASVLAVAGSTIWAGCGSGLIRSDLQPEGREFEPGSGLDETRVAILHYASLAPSGHNTQPWTVKIIGKDEWIVGADPARRLPAVDPDNREAFLSLGAFLENLTLAAGALGFGVVTEILAETTEDKDVARVKLVKAKPTGYPLTRITSRMTPKSGYRPDVLAPDAVKSLTDAAGGGLIYFPRGGEHARCIEEGAVENFRIQTARDEAQRELVGWTRLSDRDAAEHRDGLTAEGMEIRGMAGWFVRNFVKPEDFMKESNRKRSVDQMGKLAAQGGGWIIITSTGRSVSDLIETGRRFERLALLAPEFKIGVHPMTQYLEEEKGRAEIAENHPASMIPQFILRVGYLDRYPTPVSLRRPVNSFLKS